MSDTERILNEAQECANKGDIDGAIEKCNGLLSVDPKNTLIYIKLSELYNLKGDKKKASEQYSIIANAYYESKLFKGAIKYFKNVIDLDPECLDAREKLAEIYVNEGMEREAKIEFFNISEMYFNKEDIHNAETFSTKAIELKSIEAHYILGLIHLKRDMLKEAIAEFELLLKFKPNHVDAMKNLALSYFKMHKFQEAITFFEKVVKANPNDIETMEKIAESYSSKGDASAAINQYGALAGLIEKDNKEKAVEIYNKSISICNDINTKADIAKKILVLDPSNSEAKTIVSQIETPKEEVKEKEEPKEKIIEKQKKEISAAKDDEDDLSSYDMEKVTPLTDIKGTIEELFIKAENSIKDGFFEKAIEIYRYILRREPHNTVVRQKLHQAYILAAQQQDEINETRKSVASKRTDDEASLKKEKKSRISYL